MNNNNNNAMAYNPQQYESVYGFSMLDELHNFMPELLYDTTLFPNEMVNYFRHRMSQLFQPTFTRQQHIYNIYSAQERRNNFAQWRRNHNLNNTSPPPAGVPDILGALNNVFNNAPPITSNIRVEIPLNPVTPQAQIRRRASTELPSGTGNSVGTNTVNQSFRVATAPGAEPNTTYTPPPPRRQRHPNDFITANELLHLTPGTGGDVNSFLNILTGAVLGGLDIPITTTVGNRRFWQEVDVVATQAQINAGSTVVEGSTIGADVNCAICQEHTYADGNSTNQWRRLHCAHEFHCECVDSWLEQSVHCPVCRADIRDPSGTASGAPATVGGSYATAARRGLTSRNPSTS